MSGEVDHPTPVSRTARPTLLVAATATLVLLVGSVIDPPHFFRAYLIGWLLWLGAALGSLAFLMIHHLTGGRWGWPLRRPAEAATATIPFAGIAALPMVFGLRYIFPWADAAAVAENAVLRHRQLLFATPLVVSRAAFFLMVWSLLGWLLRRTSLSHDMTGDRRALARLRSISALGLVLYFITMSLASIDWIASREVDWYSSTFGLITLLGQATTGLCVLIVAVALLRDASSMRPFITDRAAHDLGNLLQTVVVLWAYVSFMQYLVIWSGNTQEDTSWFLHRTTGGWTSVGRALIGLHFAIPFALLLFQKTKRDLRALAYVAGGVLLMRVVDLLWTIVPSSAGEAPHGLHWLDLIGPIALGAFGWLCFVRQLGRAQLAPRAASDELGGTTERIGS